MSSQGTLHSQMNYSHNNDDSSNVCLKKLFYTHDCTNLTAITACKWLAVAGN